MTRTFLETDRQTDKQAYLIVAYHNNNLFRTLLQMLDNPKTDIFLHMDAKTKNYNPEEISKLVKHSRIFHAPRIKVSWGGYSLTKAELSLFELATSQGHYEHYHVLSCSDLPIKKQEEIIKFFEEHHGTEFIHFQRELSKGDKRRTRYYYVFQEIVGRPRNKILKALNLVFRNFYTTLQKFIGIHRNKGITFYKGSMWVSVSDEFARYILSKKEWIQKTFHDTLLPDEFFVQTLAANSDFRNNLFHKEFDGDLSASARLIDWERGGPYTFTLSDLEEIKRSQCMFARKFDENKDAEIIKKIKELYS